MTTIVVDIALVVVLLVLGVFGFVRATRLRSAGGRYALAMSRAIACVVVGVVLAIVAAAAMK